MNKSISKPAVYLLVGLVLGLGVGLFFWYATGKKVESNDAVQNQNTASQEESVGSETPTAEPVSNQSSTSIENNSVLRRPDHGFSVSYPKNATYKESTACFEGCPGVAVPAFIFSGSSGTASLEVDGSEYRAINHFGTGAENLADFIKSPLAKNAKQAAIPNGTRFDFDIEVAATAFTGNVESVTSYVVFVKESGETYLISASSNNNANKELQTRLAETFEFI